MVVRWACKQCDMSLPQSNMDYKGDYAITCGETLAKQPGKWGWKLLGTDAAAIPEDAPALVFFETYNPAGHIGVVKLSTGHIISDNVYDYDEWWAERVRYVFVPA